MKSHAMKTSGISPVAFIGRLYDRASSLVFRRTGFASRDAVRSEVSRPIRTQIASQICRPLWDEIALKINGWKRRAKDE